MGVCQPGVNYLIRILCRFSTLNVKWNSFKISTESLKCWKDIDINVSAEDIGKYSR